MKRTKGTRPEPRCGSGSAAKPGKAISLPVVAAAHPAVRRSRTSKWRALVLILVHLVIIGHIIHWWAAGKTLSPVEPSEAMYTLDKGHVNAGFVFFLAAILVTAVLGRFFCGWGCHIVAYQDLCAWLLKKIGIKPKPMRSRLLLLAPLALALYMFVWPSVYRWAAGIPRAPLTNHILKSAFWETFPGPVVAVLTFAVCGFAIVYFLGAKGFCTYGCPYGGFFALTDKIAPGRILVTDACEHCGHCTSVCTSNVRVHEEVALFGMVVDPGCMKCMDCVSVCPNEALYFGFAKPPIGAKPEAPRRPTPYDFTLWEEGLMVVIGLAALLIFRGLYDQIPLLMAMGMAAITAYVVMKLIRLGRTANVRLQSLQLKRGGRWTRAGLIFAVAVGALLVFTGHSAAVQYHRWQGRRMFASLKLEDDVWKPGHDWQQAASPERRALAESTIQQLERTLRWGLLASPLAMEDLVWLYLAVGRMDDAERTVRRLADLAPNKPDVHRGLANILRKAGRTVEAEAAYRQALSVDAGYEPARSELGMFLISLGQLDQAAALYQEAITLTPSDAHWSLELARLRMQHGQFAEAESVLRQFLRGEPDVARVHWLLGVTLLQQNDTTGLSHLQRAVTLDPTLAEAQFDLGLAHLQLGNMEQGVQCVRQAIRIKPDFVAAYFTLGQVAHQAGNLEEAATHFNDVVRLQPNDPDAYDYLADIYSRLGNPAGAEKAAAQAERLRHAGAGH